MQNAKNKDMSPEKTQESVNEAVACAPSEESVLFPASADAAVEKGVLMGVCAGGEIIILSH